MHLLIKESGVLQERWEKMGFLADKDGCDALQGSELLGKRSTVRFAVSISVPSAGERKTKRKAVRRDWTVV